MKNVELHYKSYGLARYAVTQELFVNQIIRGDDNELYQIFSVNKDIIKDDQGYCIKATVVPIIQAKIIERPKGE